MAFEEEEYGSEEEYEELPAKRSVRAGVVWWQCLPPLHGGAARCGPGSSHPPLAGCIGHRRAAPAAQTRRMAALAADLAAMRAISPLGPPRPAPAVGHHPQPALREEAQVPAGVL